MRELEGYRKALAHLPQYISEAEAEAEKTVRTEAVVSGGISKGMEFSEKTELYVRATGEKTGMLYTEKLSMDPMEALKQAYRNSLEGETAELLNTPQKVADALAARAAQQSEEEQKTDAREDAQEDTQADVQREAQADAKEAPQTDARTSGSLCLGTCEGQEVSAAWLHAFASEIEREICTGYGRAGSVSVRAAQVISTIGAVNSEGVDICGSTCRFDVTVNVSCREDPMRVYEETVSAKSTDEIHASYFVAQLKEWELSIRPAGKFQPGEYRAVLSSQAVNFLLVTGWKLFAAHTYQSGTNPLSGRLSEKIFSDCITIRDYSDSVYPYLLDSEGTPARDVTLVENGILKGLMHNLTTAKNAGVLSTGNGGRRALLSGNIHTDMTIVPENFTMECGEATLEELIRTCQNGIYICEAFDQFHSLNTVTGDFTFPCRGVLIEDGRLTKSVAGLSMNGNIVDLFSHVELLGCNRQIEPMAIYENYLVSGPAMLVDALRISG